MNNMTVPPPGPDPTAPLLQPILGRLPGRVLGIDAGGSATRVVLVSDGHVAWTRTAPPMNALLTAELADRLLDLIRECDPTAAGIGMPGLRSAAEAARLSEQLTQSTGCPVRVTWDGETAWLAAFGGEPGIVVFAGTGSGAVGCDGTRWARAGGHGFLLGDEGSAYWIGRAAASAALRWEDGMGGSAALHEAVVRVSGQDLDSLVRSVHSSPAERGRLAMLAPSVTALAEQDAAAGQITRAAAGHLAELAAAVRRVLGPLPVSGQGGVFRSPAIWGRFTELTGAVRSLAAPEIGAALLAGALLAGAPPAAGTWVPGGKPAEAGPDADG